MEWFIVALAVVAPGVAAMVAAGHGGSMPKDPVRDTYAMAVSEEPLDGPAVRELRFGVALRGYAMDQVDAVMDRLAVELEERDRRIAELNAELSAGLDGPASSSVAEAEPRGDELGPPLASPLDRPLEEPVVPSPAAGSTS